MNTQVTFSQRTVMRILVGFTLGIIAIHVITWVCMHNGIMQVRVFRLLFDLGDEANIPAFFSATLFLLAGTLAFFNMAVRPEGERKVFGWFFLSMVFLFLAFDEAGQIHEKFNKSMGALLGGGDMGALNFPWVLPYAVATFMFAGLAIPFLRSIDKSTVIRLVIAGVVYVCGAIGMEMWSAATFEHSFDEINYLLVVTIEESCEMLGLLLLVNALIHNLQRTGGSLDVQFKP